MPSITIQNLVKRTENIQKSMGLPEVIQASRSDESFQTLINKLSQDCLDTARDVREIFHKQNRNAADLPIRSRRAFQWIAYLSDNANLQSHLDALQRVLLFLPAYFPEQRVEFIDLGFYHLGPLYKTSQKSQTRKVILQEAFIHAPDSVFSAVLETISSNQINTSRKIIHEYAFSKDFQELRTRLEYLEIPSGAYAGGIAYNLEDSYQRVNKEYFDGELSRPHLVWSSRLTYRKFGHYQWDIDTVMISRTLDNNRVPEYLLDYVMYHELLHKKMGIRDVNGRRISHTSEFRAAEKRFNRFEEAKKRLVRLSKKKS